MKITLLNYTPLYICSTAIRKCWNSEDKSDTYTAGDKCPGRFADEDCSGTLVENGDYELSNDIHCDTCKFQATDNLIGSKDKELIDRVGNKNKHSSTLEFLTYTFEVQDISTSCLLELTRHRHASYAVQSTRYTTKKRRDELSVSYSNNPSVNIAIDKIMNIVKEEIDKGADNDDLKLLLPQAYNYSLVLQFNARSLQNFLELRTNKASHYHIKELANEIFNKLPDSHKYLFTHCIKD